MSRKYAFVNIDFQRDQGRDEQMKKLAIGSEYIELGAAKRKVRANLNFINRRIQRLHKSPSIYLMMHKHYSRKLEEQKTLLEWLEEHDQTAISG